MKCLWVSGDVPHPPAYGKLVYSAGLSEALARAGVDVVGLGLLSNDVEPPEARVRWHGVRAARIGRAASLRSSRPSMTVATTPLSAALAEHLRREPWDVVVVDHLEVGWVADAVDRSGPPIVYVAHNHERSVRSTAARRDGNRLDRRLALRWDASKAGRLERHLLERASLTVAITDHDARRFRTDAPSAEVLVLTPGYSGTRRVSRTIDDTTPRQVTIVTSLDWHVKQANLAEFVAAADPLFANAGITLAVAGRAPAEFAQGIERSARATSLLGRVDDLDQLLDDSRIGIVAEPVGGGFKLKVLDYVYHRVPTASVAGSMEGVPLRDGIDHLVFPDVGELAVGVVDIIDDYPRLNRLQQHAFDRCGSAYDWSERGTRLAEALTRVTSRPS
jgi:glycosyltransferase involved in cell wall biosynthesis